MKKLITAAALAAITVNTTGCAGLIGENMFVGQDEGRFLLSTDRAGMEAFGDTIIGLTNEAKTPGDTKGSYWQARETGLKIRTLKIQKPKK